MTAGGSGTYYCGWAITGRTTVSHLVSALRFPTAGSQHQSWCGQTITVIGLTLNVRRLPGTCPDCNRYLRAPVHHAGLMLRELSGVPGSMRPWRPTQDARR